MAGVANPKSENRTTQDEQNNTRKAHTWAWPKSEFRIEYSPHTCFRFFGLRISAFGFRILISLRSLADLVAGHLSRITHKKFAVGDGGIIPGFAVDGREAGDFLEPVRRGLHQRQFALTGKDD